jgi:putative spermidine/putrescine transport system permease protein
MRIGRWGAVLLIGGPLAFLAAFFVVPFAVLAITSLQAKDGAWTLANYIKFATDFYYWDALLLTFEVALWVTVVTFLVGYPLAYFVTYAIRNRALRRFCYLIIITPLFTSNIVRAFGWIVLLGRKGLVNDILIALGIVDEPARLLFTELSIIIGLSYILIPFMVLTVASVLQNIDRSLVDAARDLGASPFITFLKVTFPLSLPGVVAGSLIVFTLGVSAYVTPSILSGGREVVMSMLIFQQYASVLNFNFGATLAVGLLVTTLILVTGYLFAVERGTRTA